MTRFACYCPANVPVSRLKAHRTNTLLRLTTITAVLLFASGCSAGRGSVDKPNGSVNGSVQSITVDGHTRKYVCFTYTTVNRGGLWCERITPTP